MKKQIISNLSSNYINKIVTMALALFIVPFLTMKLSKEVFGITVLAESTILFFGVITNSMKMAMTRFSTYSFSEGKRDDFIGYVSSGRFLLFGCAILVLFLGGVVSFFYPHAIKISPGYLNDTKILFFLITFGFSASIPNIVFSSMVIAKQRPDLVNITMTGGALVKAVLIVIVYSFVPTQSMIPYGIIYVVSVAMQNLWVYLIFRKLLPDIKLRFSSYQKSKAREILGFTFHTSAGHLSEMLYDNTALIIIGSVWGPVSVALYSISIKFAMVLKRLFLEGAWALAPIFIDLVAKKDNLRVQQLFILYTKVMTIINTPLCILLIVLAQPLIVLWVGKEFVASAGLLPIHIIPLFMAIPFAACPCLSCAFAKVKIPSLVSLSLAVMNVFAGLLFGVVFKWGIYGIAAGAAISSFLYLSLFAPYYSCKLAGIPLRKFLVEGFLKPFALAWVVYGGGLWYLNRVSPDWISHWSSLLILAGVSAVYALLSFLLILDGFERCKFKGLFGKVIDVGRKSVAVPL